MNHQMKETDFPSYWNLLTTSDQCGYNKLKEEIVPLSYRASKDKLKHQFQIIINKIQQYVFQHDGNDSLRSLVCGIVWISGGIAVCNRHLSKLIGKCKSSINCGLQSIGYKNSSITPKDASDLAKLFPFLMGNCSEMRQWTSRVKEDETLNCEALFMTYFEHETQIATDTETKQQDLFFQTEEFDLQNEDTFSNFSIEGLDFLSVF
ncbi:potassium/sodium hyperpolarization-activated cyclic nucleotide-gated channel 1 [Histomonas meleagridis]|uniref:potassium/sodium hyperpolarization-activated cyclic nucleotide-gated channel 1 n=1 Tax=Histomonas meleagridis TaxID=135588 RepID=UPI00355A6CF8|nr:potassium/sodium hyperpolarization-activated cyclic nucleotide-gated channel 1 [Histomonas meleagridis]KAH0807005.1 potassium/sodium hyperpolarization-activated cyclic nucleotide-gated channel 1 [Histomonas meleagridis]